MSNNTRRRNVLTFEDYNSNLTTVKSSDLDDNNWDPRRYVNKNNFGKDPYVMRDKRIGDLENQIKELKEVKDQDNFSEIYDIKEEIKKLRKDKSNAVNLWIYKEYPSNSDKVLYMTQEEADGVNEALIQYRESKKSYEDLVNKYKTPTTDDHRFNRPKKEL